MTQHRRSFLRAGCGCVSLVLAGGCVGEQSGDTTNESPSAAENGTDSPSPEPDTEPTVTEDDTSETESTVAEDNTSETDSAVAEGETSETDSKNGGDDDVPDRSSLSNVIARVADADEPEAFADSHDIEYRDGDVRVLVQLEPSGELPEEHISEVTTELDGSVIAWVPVDSLVALGGDENVRSVRPVPSADTHD